MKADFSRSTFDASKHYKRVLMQQGRVQLDADWNESLDILLHRVETETKDVIGLCGFPEHNDGFGVIADPKTLSKEEQERLKAQGLIPLTPGDFLLSPGRAYVDGILCEIDDFVLYTRQPYIQPKPQAGLTPDGGHLIYLDVWERLITSLDDTHIREIALGGPDTTARSQVIWQVKSFPAITTDAQLNCDANIKDWPPQASTGTLCARTHAEKSLEDPCAVAPGAGYRRLENQLYRIEIHQASDAAKSPTFKWSRDNGSILVKIDEFNVDGSGDKLRLANLGRDNVLGLHELDWVEVLDDSHELSGTPGQLVQISKIDREQIIVTLGDPVSGFDIKLNPKLRRWDSAGELKVEIPVGNDGYIPIEDGIEVKFGNGIFHTGDYWCIAARTIPGQYGDIEWPQDKNEPACLLPFGIQHHYCKLALIKVENGHISDGVDCREVFPPLTELEQTPGTVGAADCCSVTVGDGGDFTDLQEAVDARPENAESWNICLLPGVHRLREPVIVKPQVGFSLSVCGNRTQIQSLHPQAMLAFQGVRNVRLEGLVFSAQARLGALLFANCSDVSIVSCRSENSPGEKQNDPVPAITLLQCLNVKISDNSLTGGGIQCLPGTGYVDIHRNQILGGQGAGIQLGAVDMTGVLRFFEEIARNEPAPVSTFIASNPNLQYIWIGDNLIFGMEGSGILAVNQAKFGEVSHLEISHNQIQNCATQPDLVLNDTRTVGGGIALSNFVDIKICDNQVVENGSTRACCGIFLLNGSNVEIRDNVIENNGSQAQTDAAENYQAGIAAFFILGTSQSTGTPPGMPALRAYGNRVNTPAGLAFFAVVMGATQIVNNVFVSQRRREQTPLFGMNEMGLCIQILNSGFQSRTEGLAMNPVGRVHLENVKSLTRASALQIPQGQLMFHDNQVALLFLEAQEPQLRRIVVGSAFSSPNDVSLQGNQFQVDIPPDQMLANVVVMGGTIRASGNHFRELTILGRGASRSYFSVGVRMNITSLNTAENCIAACCKTANYNIEQNNLVQIGADQCKQLTEDLCSMF